jgi:hypothetical protein
MLVMNGAMVSASLGGETSPALQPGTIVGHLIDGQLQENPEAQ